MSLQYAPRLAAADVQTDTTTWLPEEGPFFLPMDLIALLNRCYHHPGFVYQQARFCRLSNRIVKRHDDNTQSRLLSSLLDGWRGVRLYSKASP